MNKKIKKILSIILTIVMIMQLTPINAFAKENKTNSTNFVSREENNKIVDEIIDERDEHKKVYELSDGTYYEINSYFPIHEKKNGNWKEPSSNYDIPKNTSEAIETCAQLSKEITSDYNEYGISPTSIDITDQNTPNVEYTIVSTTKRDLKTLKNSNVLIAKIPNTNINSSSKQQATISSNVYIDCQMKSAKSTKIYAYRINSDWNIDNTDLTSTDIKYNENIVDFTNINSSDTYSWDITDTYLKWEKATWKNNGLAFKIKDNGSTAIGGIYTTRQYKLIDSHDSDFSYHSIDMGRAGTVYINDFTNTILLARDEFGISGNLLPIELKRYFDFGRNYATTNPSGEGARWNYESKLNKITSLTYAWETFEGSTIYFTPTDNMNKWKDSLGLGYTLTIDTQAINNDNFSNSKIESPEGSIYTFSTNGKVLSITDKYNTKIEIHYTTSSYNFIDYILDGSNHKYCFNYSQKDYDKISINTLNSITIQSKNQNGKFVTVKIGNEDATINYEYALLPNNHIALTKVKYPDNESVSYTFDKDGHLTKITDIDGRILSLNYEANFPIYSYNNGKIETEDVLVDQYPSLTQYKEMVKNIDDDPDSDNYQDYLLKSSLDIDRHNNYQRTFTNHLGEIEKIQYNQHLKVLYLNNSHGETFYADYTDDDEGNDVLTQIVSPEKATNLLKNSDFEGKEIDPWYENDGNSLKVVNGTLSSKGDYILNVDGTTTDIRACIQNVKVDAKENDIFVIGGWSRANAPISTAEHFFGFEVYSGIVDDEDDEDDPIIETDDTPIYSLSFDTTLDYENQFRLGAFKVPKDTKYLQVRLVYSNQAGFASFDEIQLYKSTDENVTFFDNNGEKNDNLFSLDNITETKSENNTITNDLGLTTAEIVKSGDKSLLTKYTYDDNYYISSITNSNNVTTNYSYNASNGTLESSTIGNKTTSFSYTPMGALKEVSLVASGLTDNFKNITTAYSYNHDKISSISHNGVKYNLIYNSFGNIKSIQYETLPNNSKSDLISYNYSNNYQQKLDSIEYANGNILSYSYDKENNINEIFFQNNSSDEKRLVYKYEYKNSNLVKIVDYDSEQITEFVNDGYKISEFAPNEENLSEIYSVSKSSNGNITERFLGKEYQTIKCEDKYDDSNLQTDYSSKATFLISNNNKNYKVNFESNANSDYFGRIKSTNFKFYSPEIDDSKNTKSSRSITSKYSYKNYDTSYKDASETINVSATTGLIDQYSAIVSKKVTYDETKDDGTPLDSDEITSEFSNSYEYDKSGRITHIYLEQKFKQTGDSNIEKNTDKKLISYFEYDNAGQLITDANFQSNKVIKYSYDSCGNITEKKVYDGEDKFSFINNTLKTTSQPSNITNYQYNSGDGSNNYCDLLTSYNGNQISYDLSGNPLVYYGVNESNNNCEFNLTWKGSLLKSAISLDGSKKYEYSYNDKGLRTKKTAYILNTSSNKWEIESYVKYIWNNDLLYGYEYVNYNSDNKIGKMAIKMIYDEFDSPIGLFYSIENDVDDSNFDNFLSSKEDIYWFIKDGQDNIIAMYSETNNFTLGCSYDAYGNLKIDLSGSFVDKVQKTINDAISQNPSSAPIITFLMGIVTGMVYNIAINMDQINYRGYIFDNETGLYYCQSRYYSPCWGRFISMDAPLELTKNLEEPLSTNLYIYNYNDPVNNTDINGRSSYSLTGVGIQAEMSTSLLSFAGEVGIELIYTWTKNALYGYFYYGGGAGVGYTNRAINYLSSSLRHISVSPKVSLKNIANLFKLNYSISIGFFAAFTTKSFSWPYSYVGFTNSKSVSIGKYKGYKSTSPGCKTYGICYSPVGNSGFAFSNTTAKYNLIVFNSSKILNYLKNQKNKIKNAVN